MSVTYQKLASRIQKRFDADPSLPQLNQQQLILFMSHMFLTIGDALASGEDVYLDGFGRFYPGVNAPRKVNTPITGEGETGYRIKVKFNPFKALEEQVESYLIKIGLPIETKEKNDASSALEKGQ